MENAKQKCGFVTLLGAPNAGKSTLVNMLVGSKISIVTPKAQTTRRRLLGSTNFEETQLVLVDTPGIFNPKRPLEKAMVHEAWRSMHDADVIAVLVDSTKPEPTAALRILGQLKEKADRVVAILNKVDAVSRPELLILAEKLQHAFPELKDIFMVSALTGEGCDDLRKGLSKYMPEQSWYFPEDQLSDMSLRFMCAEITREKIFLNLNQEIPYNTMVVTETWEAFKNGSVKINQMITVEREGQKALMLGREGKTIKRIGQAARRDMELLLEQQVHLFLSVRVEPNWTEKTVYHLDQGTLDMKS